MNEPTIRLETRPEITAFVERVRARLADLSDEDREELVGGLEADIAELVADGGSVAELGDPRAYADELRAAAGLEQHRGASAAEVAPRAGVHQRFADAATRVLDGSRRRWSELVEVPAMTGPWQLLASLRPVWWVARAWVAVQLLAAVTQGWALPTILPLLGGPVVGALLWVVAVVVSVQMGRNRWWPGSGARRRPLARVLLLGLNAFAVAMTPLTLAKFPDSGAGAYDTYATAEWSPPPGLSMAGTPVGNVFPYDAQGRPLEGVQLFDQDGRPLTVSRTAGEEYDDRSGRLTVSCPWFNGGQRLFNVFPLPRREQSTFSDGWRLEADAWTSANPPALPLPPLAAVPPATLPLPADAAGSEPGAGPETGGRGSGDRRRGSGRGDARG